VPLFRRDGTDLFFADDGAGNPLVFVPGLGGTHAMFGPQVATFSATHRLIRPDLRGNGRSGRLAGPIGTVLDRQCDDLAALLDHLELDRAVMLGVSYGGAVALRFALRHPDRSAGLVAVDTFEDLNVIRSMDMLILVGSYLTVWAFYLPRPLLRGFGRLVYRRRPAALEVLPALVEGLRPYEAALQSLAVCGVGPARDLTLVRCPTLGIVGDASRTAVRLMRRAMAPIPGARLEVVEDSFDPSNLCQPEAFNRLLAGFLRDIGWCDPS
jgi:pimeloyl-ACP methyl ester carboxylesterase